MDIHKPATLAALGLFHCTVVAIEVQYTAIAIGPSADVECNTTDLNCTLTHKQCGSQYNVSVTATQNSCTAQPSTGYSFITAPCVPVLNDVALNCSSRSAVVMWSSSGLSPDVFSVSAVNIQGGQLDCGPLNGHSCVVDGLQCGQMYTFSVNATQGQCTSFANNTLQRQTAPCPPQNIQSRINCGNNTASVSWSRGNGTLSFTSTLDCSNGQTYICKTTETGCDITNLPCGQTCTVMLVAEGQSCNSSIGTGSYVTTAPCPPQNIQSRINCGNNTASVSWSRGNGTLSFTSTLDCSNGQTYICKTTETGCDITNLPCGQTCTVMLVAEGQSCNSSIGTGSYVTTAPCPPQNIQSRINCGNNTASVSWSRGNGTLSFTSTLDCSNGQTYICKTTETGCDITNLPCGQTCTVMLVAEGQSCNSSIGTGSYVTTGSCVGLPQNVSANVSCSNIATVSWGRSQGAELYSVTAISINGLSANCTSASTSCDLSTLTCGETYTIMVKANGSNCNSENSAPVQVQSAPCPPQNIQSRINCGNNTASVSWSRGNGTLSFTSTLDCSNGQTYICKTTETGCDITNLPCGQTCTVMLVAEGQSCNSSIGTGSYVTTVPCKPNNLTLGVHCGNSSASLSWAASTGAVAYVGIAQSGNVTTVYCQSTNTSCTLQGLVCGTVYNFTVQASDGICNSSFSEPLTDGAAPCPPGGLRAIPRTVVNDTQILRASWSAVDCPDSEYLLELRGRILDITQALFDVASYWTSRTFFEIPLPCGSSYSATVRAQNSASSSVPSAAVSGTTVPCAPQNVTFSASLSMVTWNQSVFASNYTVYQVTSSSRTKLCMTPMLQCSLANISSGHIVATASNSAGESEDSSPVLVTAGRRR
ncbi:fibronectin type III domain-containing protein 7-like [Xyrauchen texanus]|uniref:fibronectin type III domain-containing protein 7-like n=1 Tax=Xyrauchen texanus TaxID=154827 RepID=UPI0022422FE0|nr:fibronectin type III domain-containing protein 7-like [Xyrauchen texanus]